jgi:hypothetical protein
LKPRRARQPTEKMSAPEASEELAPPAGWRAGPYAGLTVEVPAGHQTRCILAKAPLTTVAQVIAGGAEPLFDGILGGCLVDAASYGRPDVLRLLLARPSGWVPPAEVAARALDSAAGNDDDDVNNTACIRELLRGCPQISAEGIYDALWTACATLNDGCAGEILKNPRAAGAVDRLLLEQTNAFDENDEEPRFWSRWEEMRAALEAGGVPTAEGAGRALRVAAGNRDLESLALLLERCPQITPRARSEALEGALRGGAPRRAAAVRCLLREGGAEPSPQALAEAAELGEAEVLCAFAPFIAKALRAGLGAEVAADGTGEAAAGGAEGAAPPAP